MNMGDSFSPGSHSCLVGTPWSVDRGQNVGNAQGAREQEDRSTNCLKSVLGAQLQRWQLNLKLWGWE